MIRLLNAFFGFILLSSGICTGGTMGLAVAVLGLWYLCVAM